MLFASKPLQNATKHANSDNYTQRNVKSALMANVKCTKFCLKMAIGRGVQVASASSFLFHVKHQSFNKLRVALEGSQALQL